MDEKTTPQEFGLLFKRFLDDIVNRAEVPEGPLLKRLREHLGGEPMRMPVISEEFERFQQPNLQVAMDAYLERPGNSAELIGLAAENKRNWGLGLSDFVNRGTSPYSLRLAEGPVDWVNFHLDGDRVLPVVQFGLYLMKADGAPLVAAGRPIKRGLLLYGSPGTGKTLTVMYLAGRMKGRTVLLTTGRGLGFIGAVAQMARVLAPSMVVVEDVDLIAQERGMPGMQAQPMLFELLNEMDGLRDDVDVLFVLTTNRPDILEPALAARPGRVDLAVPLPLPDADARRRLFALYGRGLRLEVADLDRFIARTEGASPAYIKELLRNATVFGAIDGDGAGTVRVTD